MGPWRGLSGRPTSSNGASSMHLWWDGHADEVVAASVTLTVVERPPWDDLCFWALQASFTDSTRSYGAAHLGLQWYSRHPGSTAVNFGGYRDGGGELSGSESRLPSATGNPNTRDFSWEPGRGYRLAIALGADGPGTWTGLLDDVVIRTLSCPGDRLAGFVVWTECFAPCDAAPSTVRWSDPSLALASGATLRPSLYRATYQSVTDGGCATGSARPASGGGVLQVTGGPPGDRPRTLEA
jgi:hypothetical protein